jgi:hypothetical protein
MMVMMMSENQPCQSQVHVTAFQGTEGLAPKSGVYIGGSMPILQGGGTWFSPNTLSRDKETDGKHTLAKGHHANPAHF